MSQNKIDILQRALQREKNARKQAEKILENKSRELYFLTEELKKVNSRLEESVSEKTKDLEKSNQELEEYAHIVSHDLKSPLRSIEALTTWIKTDNKEKFDEQTLQNFSLIEKTLEKMEQLITDVLEYSSVTKSLEENKEVNLNNVLENLQQILYIPKHISIKIVNKLPIIKGDKTKFRQLFQNLISNAIKFNNKEKGIIEIDVENHNSFYKFSVKDNGIGIQKKHFNKIFKIFQSLQKTKESSGVGLSIVKKIVTIYKGEIWLQSEVNKGTTFYFTLKK